MKKVPTRDVRENRAQRQEKLGSPCDSLPAKTLLDRAQAKSRSGRTKVPARSR